MRAPGTWDLADSRRQLLLDSLGITVSAGGFGLVYGLSAGEAGFSPIEAGAMSILVFAGAAQFRFFGARRAIRRRCAADGPGAAAPAGDRRGGQRHLCRGVGGGENADRIVAQAHSD